MRLLADENFPKEIVERFSLKGVDVLWARTSCKGWKDAAILELAESEARIVLTLDKDFWQIAVQRRQRLEKSGVVLFRVHPATVENLMPLMDGFLSGSQTWTGHISIITKHGIQMLRSSGA